MNERILQVKMTLVDLALLTKDELTKILKTNEDAENYEACSLINKVLKNKDKIDLYLMDGEKKLISSATKEIEKIIEENEKSEYK